MTEGTLHTVDYEMIEFQNELFVRGKPDLIGKIRRKDAKPRPVATQVNLIIIFKLTQLFRINTLLISCRIFKINNDRLTVILNG